MQHGVHIHIHQVVEILVIAAGYRITGLVRIGKCIQKCVQRTLRKLHKRILRRELIRTAEHGMLGYMRHARIVCGCGPERDTEYLVLILVRYDADPCSALDVPEHHSLSAAVRYMLLVFESVIGK